MTDRRGPLWPSRQTWAADAGNFARTVRDPTERVSDDPAHWLTSEELAELRDQLAETVKATLREIGRAQRASPDQAKTLQSDRVELNAHAHDVRRECATVTEVVFGIDRVLRVARRQVDDATPSMYRLGLLRGVLSTRRDHAAQYALRAAIDREVARRNSDEGWERELERRRRIAHPTVTDTATQH